MVSVVKRKTLSEHVQRVKLVGNVFCVVKLGTTVGRANLSIPVTYKREEFYNNLNNT